MHLKILRLQDIAKRHFEVESAPDNTKSNCLEKWEWMNIEILNKIVFLNLRCSLLMANTAFIDARHPLSRKIFHNGHVAAAADQWYREKLFCKIITEQPFYTLSSLKLIFARSVIWSISRKNDYPTIDWVMKFKKYRNICIPNAEVCVISSFAQFASWKL